MKHAAIALRGLITDGLGIEGFLLIVGVALLAYGSTYISPAGPYLVVGGAATILGIALALPGRPPAYPPQTLNDRLGIASPPPEVR